MAASTKPVVFDDLRGGMNGVDDPLSLPSNECLYALNVDWWRASVGHKRHGSSLFTSTGTTMAGKVSTLIRHVPGTDETAMELWAVDSTPTVNRYDGSSWSAPTLKDAITGNGWEVQGATVNGKLFLAYKSAQNRLHLWDGSTVRRAGINPGSSAPTVANTGAGAYAATLRYYRVRFYGPYRMSEPTPSVSFTPSGAGTAARVTRPTAPSEDETNWIVEGSTDNATFYQIGNIAIATTTYDDSTAPAAYSAGTLSPLTGTFTLQKPYKFIAGADNRLLGFGSWNSSDPQHRIEWSAVVGGVTLGAFGNPTADAAERVDTTGLYYLDLDENDTGSPTGLVGPVNGNYYAFKSNGFWVLRPTGDVSQPFKATCLSKVIGAVEQRAITRGEDQSGRPCIYFMSQFGPYRYGANGLEYIGRKIDNYIRGASNSEGLVAPSLTLKVNASSVCTVALYHPAKRQVWWWFAVNEVADNSGTIRCLMLDTLTGGWSEYSGIETTRAACLYKDPNGSGKELVPYMAASAGNNAIWVLDNPSATSDASGTSFAAYIITAPVQPFGPGGQGSTSDWELVTTRTSSGTVSAQAYADLDATLASDTASVTLTNTTGSKWLRVSGAQLADARAISLKVGDFSASANTWRFERIAVMVHPQEATIA